MKTFITVLLSVAPLMILLGSPKPQTAVPDRTLTFAERVSYQNIIEDVYWRHRIWPKENPGSKPSLDAVMSQAQLENEVQEYVHKSQALEDYWKRPITADQLQAEMDRMATHTKQPEVLHELFEALGNDPFVIAECLARPALSARFYGELKLWAGSWSARAENQTPNVIAAVNANYILPTISDGGCTDDTWAATSTTNAPEAREAHTAVWTGSEMIVWGGSFFDGTNTHYFNTGGKYIPSTDSWTATSTTNAPEARVLHTAVWTGSEMIIWGAYGESSYLNTGGRYNLSTDSWTATSTSNAPSARGYHTAVWTGSEMIVWGGVFSDGTNNQSFNTGGRYNPNADGWTATSTTNAPSARAYHTAVWTGSEMIVWGGEGDSGPNLNTGGRYNPSTNSWTPTTTIAPEGRRLHTAVWTGSQMIIWGGEGPGYLNTGGRYNPSTNSWTPTTTIAPDGRLFPTAVWTGSEMVIWGGFADGPTYFNTGGRYSPSTNRWTETTTTYAPEGRWLHTAVWTGSRMIVWGGRDENSINLNTGGRYCASSGTPRPTPTPRPTANPKPRPTPSPRLSP